MELRFWIEFWCTALSAHESWWLILQIDAESKVNEKIWLDDTALFVREILRIKSMDMKVLASDQIDDCQYLFG